MIETYSNTIKADWENIEIADNNVNTFLSNHKYNPDEIDTICMVVSELLSNAVKYGKFEVNDHIEYSIVLYVNRIIIEVKNPVDEENEQNYENLDEIIQWIRGFHTPFEAYIDKLKEVSGKPIHNNENNLGLVRIAYEGESILDFYINEEKIISVSAVYMLNV